MASTDITGGIADFLGAEMSDAVEFLERDELQRAMYTELF